MPTLSNILNDSAEVEVETSDGIIHIQYYPSRITQRMYKEAAQFSAMLERKQKAGEVDEALLDNAFRETNKILLNLIRSWDLNEQEEPEVVRFPLDAERLNELPLWLIDDISKRIMGNSRPNQIAPKKKTRN